VGELGDAVPGASTVGLRGGDDAVGDVAVLRRDGCGRLGGHRTSQQWLQDQHGESHAAPQTSGVTRHRGAPERVENGPTAGVTECRRLRMRRQLSRWRWPW
ncbi:MAG: hypothetical protein ACK55I_45460, partial [bacterium]